MKANPRRCKLAIGMFGALLAYMAWCAAGPTPDAKPNVETLRKKADEAIALGTSIDGIAKMQDIFNYVDFLQKQGNETDYGKYLKEALVRKPWALPYQLLYANVLRKSGDAAEADKRVKLVLDRAEDDATEIAARRMLNMEASPGMAPYGLIPGEGPVVVFVPIGEVDILLMSELAQGLSDRLGIPVLAQQANVVMPLPKRDGYTEYLAQMRKDIQTEDIDSPEFAQELKRQEIKVSDLQRDDALESFLKKSVAASAPEDQYRKLCHMLEVLKTNEKQWATEDLLKSLANATAAQQRKSVLVIGLTTLDIFSGNCNFVYFSVEPARTVLSYCRYRAVTTQEQPNRERLLARLRKACLSAIGLMCGVDRCSNPECPVSFQMTLQEHDAKTEDYCTSCQKTVEKAIGHPIPPAPAHFVTAK